ncbi:peptide chain release factor 3 [Roseiconus nitratireducens]|uniref:Peptide chain release factor 3 n=1 Tax=Roseiconus nitratireducens TaxID=2605748 RepID=A0A5M6DF28_9BACT|nr:peptide chain release factor 3 [Roseiconus nitratireducens]KAA5546171.1 peptide chain release factor 3 [Roseiconus nitratireducens]
MNTAKLDSHVEQERKRRRTFAIISHPDAGKTTLTEKLLLFGGSIEIAGAVRGRKSQRTATSDWMDLEKQRGISVSSTVLTFEYDDCQINLLDTPGHHDFSEDTYRTLMAADAAVMVIDLAKGIEAQTEKLFRVCALRKIPVLTFVNKVDRPGRDRLEILEEIERKFSIEAVPQNWPLGSGRDFSGVVDLESDRIHVFDPNTQARRLGSIETDWQAVRNHVAGDQLLRNDAGEPLVLNGLTPELVDEVHEEVELVRMAGATLEADRFLRGEQTPVYFGSALTDFGVEHFLKGFIDLCPPPGNRLSNIGPVPAGRKDFSGFVFKIQANLDPRHRDRVAFMRISSGKFERDMEVTVARSGKRLRLPRALRIFGQERETVDLAYPGDIIGVVCPGEFRLGDTLCEGDPVHYEPLPQFSPEFFAVLECPDTSRRKQFDRGIEQLVEEGAIQMFHDARSTRREMILAAVGELQFDVVKFRLESEYNTSTNIQWRPYKMARWFNLSEEEKGQLKLPFSSKIVRDQFGHDAVLLQSEWHAQTIQRDNPGIEFHAIRVSPFEGQSQTSSSTEAAL